ncbi:MAG: DUF1415 domain-containing protein [Burkholderiaceae bacterium]
MRLAADDAVAQQVVRDTRRWLERAVIGLNLCPFAKAVAARGQIHWAVSDAVDAQELLQDLQQEMNDLLACSDQVRDTSVLMAVACMDDFWEFNGLLARAQTLLRHERLEGVLQVASFHPHYQFADADAEAIGNCTNRAPYPTLHLLRESSVERAVASFSDASHIVERNLATLQRLGAHGWRALGVGRSPVSGVLGVEDGQA